MKRKHIYSLTGPKVNILTRFKFGTKKIVETYKMYKKQKYKSNWDPLLGYLKLK